MELLALPAVEGSQNLILDPRGGTISLGQRPATAGGQLDERAPPVLGIRPALDEAAVLEPVREGDHKLGSEAHEPPELVLRPRAVALQHGQRGVLARREVER